MTIEITQMMMTTKTALKIQIKPHSNLLKHLLHNGKKVVFHGLTPIQGLMASFLILGAT